MSRQSASCCWTSVASQSRISWSSAPRLSGFEIRMRVTFAAGASTISLPDANVRAPGGVPSGCGSIPGSVDGWLLKDHQRVALGDRLPLLAPDLPDDALVLGLDRHLHLHGFEDHEGVALDDFLSDLALDLPDG